MLLPTIQFKRGRIKIIDQRLLPGQFKIESLESVDELCRAIESLAVRGAPALGVAGAFGLLLAIDERWGRESTYFFDMEGNNTARFPAAVSLNDVRTELEKARAKLAATRPTAVNLSWALERMRRVYESSYQSSSSLLRAVHQEAISIYMEDVEMCRKLSANGAKLLKDNDAVLTHCNTGGLATSGFGTALGVVFSAVEEGKRICVYADETRPLLQGARLTAWECVQRDIPVTIVTEGMAGYLMDRGILSCIIVGADRIAANGDTANKIGTLNLAIIAKRYGVPFYVAAPSTTVDQSIADGSRIPIEERSEAEVKEYAGMKVAPVEASALNPAFDVTPHELISAIITEEGLHYPPFGRWTSADKEER